VLDPQLPTMVRPCVTKPWSLAQAVEVKLLGDFSTVRWQGEGVRAIDEARLAKGAHESIGHGCSRIRSVNVQLRAQ
jgi:hypothetical protein